MDGQGIIILVNICWALSLYQFILPSKLVILSPANYSLIHFFNFLIQTAFAYYIIGPDTGQYFAQDTSVFQAWLFLWTTVTCYILLVGKIGIFQE